MIIRAVDRIGSICLQAINDHVHPSPPQTPPLLNELCCKLSLDVQGLQDYQNKMILFTFCPKGKLYIFFSSNTPSRCILSEESYLTAEKLYPVFALIFFTYLPENQIQKNCLFIQTNSFIIFTGPNPVLLVPGFGQVGYIYTLGFPEEGSM